MSEGLLAELAGPPRPLSLRERAGVIGGFCFVEEEAFRALGDISATLDGPAGLRLLAAGAARAHAWRAGELGGLLPVSVGLPGRHELVRAPSKEVAAFAHQPARALERAPEQVSALLRGFYDLLSQAYETRLAHLHEGADDPLARTFRRLLSSLADQLREVERFQPGNRLGA